MSMGERQNLVAKILEKLIKAFEYQIAFGVIECELRSSVRCFIIHCCDFHKSIAANPPLDARVINHPLTIVSVLNDCHIWQTKTLAQLLKLIDGNAFVSLCSDLRCYTQEKN